MKQPIVFMFPGQGSQYYHMGKELYENHSRFRLWMDYCDDIVHAHIKTSLIDAIYQEKRKTQPFDELLYTNPALLCIEFSLTRVLMEAGIDPDYLLGYSLGEITASVISGAVSLDEGIQLVVDNAKLLQNESPPAGMLAIIESESIMDQFPDIFQNCWVTGRNFHNNFVVSGLIEDIRNLQMALSQKNIVAQRLPVKYGFHTELMDPIERKFKQIVRNINLSPIKIPIISALKSEEIHEISDDHFWRVVRYPVEFEKTIRSMLRNGGYIFIDVGPSGTLATFVKYLLSSNSNSFYFETLNQFGRDLNSITKLETAMFDVVHG